jgi:hypothetical protein
LTLLFIDITDGTKFHPIQGLIELSKTPLQLPLGIQVWKSELRRNQHLLVEGYTMTAVEETNDAYRFTIAASAEKIPTILRAFCEGQVDEAFLILEYYPKEILPSQEDAAIPEVFYSAYRPIDELFATLDPYMERLIHDGFVGFGLANNRSGLEIFFSEEKTISCFTDNHIRVTNLMHKLGLPHLDETSFHMDLGHDHLSLLCHDDGILPEPLCDMSKKELNFIHFCGEIVDQLDMYPVEETLSFFLTRKDQDAIEALFKLSSSYAEYAEEDFGSFLLDWNDFVSECTDGFEGDLVDYQLGLHLRDIIEHIISRADDDLARKLIDVVSDPDHRFQEVLTNRRKRIDRPSESIQSESMPFWYQGVVEKSGVTLRRDLIRADWFKPGR